MAKIHQMPQPVGLYGGELLQRASDYVDAFERLIETPGKQLQFPMYFLLAHAIEILLKAHLAARGNRTKRQFVNLGHRLDAIYADCDPPIRNVKHLDRLVAYLTEMNRHHDFRYPSGYKLAVPSPTDCLPVVRELQATISPAVNQSAIKAQIQHASDTRHLTGDKIQWSD
jgi:hypothetical protein